MSVRVLLPLNTRVFIHAYTNALFIQRITLIAPDGRRRILQGSGEGNIIGSFVFHTPERRQGAQVFPVKVRMEFSTDGGRTFRRSRVIQDRVKFSRVPFKVIGVFAEDAEDEDFNDAIVTFSFRRPV